MPRWKPRDPSIFPARFAEVVEQASQSSTPILLSTHKDLYEVKMAADRFREWRFCLRQSGNPANRGYATEINSRITLQTNKILYPYSLWVSVKSNPISDLLTLNPNLAGIIPTQ